MAFGLLGLKQNSFRSYVTLYILTPSRTEIYLIQLTVLGLQQFKKVSLGRFAEHFKKLNTVSAEDSDQFHTSDPSNVSQYNFELDTPFTEHEVLKSINSLRLNKACASDLILKEFLKSSKSKMLTAFTK